MRSTVLALLILFINLTPVSARTLGECARAYTAKAARHRDDAKVVQAGLVLLGLGALAIGGSGWSEFGAVVVAAAGLGVLLGGESTRERARFYDLVATTLGEVERGAPGNGARFLTSWLNNDIFDVSDDSYCDGYSCRQETWRLESRMAMNYQRLSDAETLGITKHMFEAGRLCPPYASVVGYDRFVRDLREAIRAVRSPVPATTLEAS